MSSKPVKRIKISPKRSLLGRVVAKLTTEKKGLPQSNGELIFTAPHANQPIHALHVRKPLPIYDAEDFPKTQDEARRIISRLKKKGYTKYNLSDLIAAMIYENNNDTE